jgi:hypothetical protein
MLYEPGTSRKIAGFYAVGMLAAGQGEGTINRWLFRSDFTPIPYQLLAVNGK